MFDDPEPELGVVDEGDGRFGSAGDLVIAALEIDGVVVVDAALLAKGKVQVEQRRGRCGAEALGAGQQGVFPDGEGDEAGAALAGAVLALEFHLKDVVGVLGGGDFGVGQEGDEAALEGAETAFDFAFCLRGGCDEVGDAEGAEGALEFALRVAAVAAGAWAEEAEGIGVDGLGDAVVFKGGAEVAEVVPGGVGGDETGGDVEAGMVIDGEEEDLLLRSGPPLVDGAVVLPKLADVSPAKTAVSANAWRRSREQKRKVRFEKGLDAGAGADKAEEPLHFIGHELKIERLAQRDKLLKKSADVVRPDAPVGTAAGDGAEGLTAARPSRAQFVEAGLCDAELSGRRGGIEGAGIELAENAADKLGREAVVKLLFFIPSSCASAEQARSKKRQAWAARLGGGHRYAPASSEASGPRFHAPVFTHSAFVPSPFRFCTGPDRKLLPRVGDGSKLDFLPEQN